MRRELARFDGSLDAGVAALACVGSGVIDDGMGARVIEILFVENCPGVAVCEARVREAVTMIGGAADVRMVKIETPEDASARRFLGSPTVLVDGRDVDVASRGSTEYGVQCRLYEHEGRLERAPRLESILTALRSSARLPS